MNLPLDFPNLTQISSFQIGEGLFTPKDDYQVHIAEHQQRW